MGGSGSGDNVHLTLCVKKSISESSLTIFDKCRMKLDLHAI